MPGYYRFLCQDPHLVRKCILTSAKEKKQKKKQPIGLIEKVDDRDMLKRTVFDFTHFSRSEKISHYSRAFARSNKKAHLFN